MEMPLVSVIVPVFNGARFIESCINHLLEQSYENIEFIIVNDGSTDDTRVICEKIKEYKKNECIIILSQERQGVSAARNKGMDAASGKYLVFVDVDDSLEYNAIENCVKKMVADELDLLVFGYYFDVPNERSKSVEHIANTSNGYFCKNKNELRDALVDLYDLNLMYNVWNKVFRKDIIDKYTIRFPMGKIYNEDRDYVREYLIHTDRLRVIPDCYYHYVRTDSSTTGAFRRELFDIRKEEYTRLKDFFELYGLKDSKTTEYVARQHLERVMGCVDNLFLVPDHNGRMDRRKYLKTEIKRMLTDDLTRKVVREAKPKSKKMKIMTIPYRVGSVNGVYFMTDCIHYVKQKYPQLFHKLKQTR